MSKKGTAKTKDGKRYKFEVVKRGIVGSYYRVYTSGQGSKITDIPGSEASSESEALGIAKGFIAGSHSSNLPYFL